MNVRHLPSLLVLTTAALACSDSKPVVPESPKFGLITLDPGHFHASLVQKSMYPDVDSVVHVFAPEGDDVQQHLKRIEAFNKRPENPTHWVEDLYTGPDFLEKMIASKSGNIVVIAGNNARKTDYIVRSIGAGLNVLADKPMVRTPADLVRLQQAFDTAKAKGVLLYDIMTERSEATTQLQRELSMKPELFGTLVNGTLEDPAVTKVSVHHFSKIVSGAPLKRPEWFFDVQQEGEGIVDVTTHLVDLVQWEAFPDQTVELSNVTMLSARRWATPVSLDQFKSITGAAEFPAYLKDIVKDGKLQVTSNGEMNYTINGIHARVSVTWNWEAPPGTGDTHYSLMHGTKAKLMIRQGKEQNFKPRLYVERDPSVTPAAFDSTLASAVASLQAKFPGVAVAKEGEVSVIVIPAKYDVGHESHFSQVADRFLGWLRGGKMPEWEVPNMITKYGTIMKAYTMSGGR